MAPILEALEVAAVAAEGAEVAGELAGAGAGTAGEAGVILGEGVGNAALGNIEIGGGLPGELGQSSMEIGGLPSDMSGLEAEIGALPDDLNGLDLEIGELPDDMTWPEPEIDELPDDTGRPEPETGRLPGTLGHPVPEGGEMPDGPEPDRASERPADKSAEPLDSSDSSGEKEPGQEGRENDEPERKMEPAVEIVFKCPEGCDPGEFNRQLKDQEKGLNDMTLKDFLENREKYKQNGREGQDVQEDARKRARADKVKEYRDQGMSREEAEEKADEWLKSQAALHNPDQVAGGDPKKVDGVGDSKINSSIGGQWGGGRADQLEQQVRDYIKENGIQAEDLGKIKMNIQLDVA